MENEITSIQPDVPVQPEKKVAEKSQFTKLFLVLFVLGIIFLGGTYLLITSQKKTTIPPTVVKNTTLENQKDFSDMQNELDNTNAQDEDSDFVQIDQEMKNL
ncbi:MAG: hypothetical protein KBD46_02835 [Candidatus Levybacteria bacterium]|nr:hypothetical protein [Candidatus Levybacteria bacterium]